MNYQHLSLFSKYLVLVSKCVPSRCLSFTPINALNQKWRMSKGLPLNPNACGVLTDSPDYSYLDGRPTPYGSRQRKRIIKNKEIAEKIIALTSEVDFAVSRYNQMQLDAEKKKQEIIENKLKPKGLLLLRKNKS